MAVSRGTVLTLLACILTVNICKGDDCQEASNKLMGCYMDSDLDYSRLSDPNYMPTLCREARRLLDCSDEARDDCPNLDQFSGDFVKAIASMEEMTNTYCAEEPMEDCPNPAGDVMACAQGLQTLTPNNMCSGGAEYLSCMRTIQERCEGHPMLNELSIDSSLQSIENMLRHSCVSPQRLTTTTSSLEEIGDDSDDDNDDSSATLGTCTRLESKFRDQLQQCTDILFDDLSEPTIICRAVQKARTCVKSLMRACRKREWMTEEVVEGLVSGLNALREIQIQHQCQTQTTSLVKD